MEYITPTQIAKLMDISRIAVFKKIKSGKIKCQMIGEKNGTYIIEKEYGEKYANDYKRFKELTAKQKTEIENAVRKVKEEYGETLRLLGQD